MCMPNNCKTVYKTIKLLQDYYINKLNKLLWKVLTAETQLTNYILLMFLNINVNVSYCITKNKNKMNKKIK